MKHEVVEVLLLTISGSTTFRALALQIPSCDSQVAP